MGKVEKMSYSQVREELTKLVNVSAERGNSSTYVVSYLKGLAAELIADLPKEQQQIYINEIRNKVHFV